MKKASLLALLLLALVSPALVAPVFAASAPTNALRQVDDLPTVALSPYDNWFWHRPDNAFVYATPTGDIGVATVVKLEGRTLRVRTYDQQTLAMKGSAKIITFPEGWTQWGGITQLADGSFVVLNGRTNSDETVGREVFAVRRYSADWTAGAVGYLKSGTLSKNTDLYKPFDGVKPAMTVVGDRLVVHTARTKFETPDRDHHQTDLTFEVDLPTMKVARFDALGDAPSSSHSFSQQVAMNGDDLVFVDHGDFAPRAVRVSVMADYPTKRAVKAYDVLEIAGLRGDNRTGLSVTGFVSGPQGVVVLGNSGRQDVEDGEPWGDKRNLFAIALDPSTGAKTVRWLTDFDHDGAKSSGEPRVVQVAEDRFAVLSDVVNGTSHSTDYRLIDSAGNVLAKKSFADTFFSGISQPVQIGDRVLWVNKTATDQEYSAWMYALDVSDPSAPTFVTENLSYPKSPKPVVTGTAQVGSALVADPGDWGLPEGPDFGYQWRAGGVDVPGATQPRFTPKAAQLGEAITVVVTASSAGYATTSRTSRATAAVAPGRITPATPTITGSARVGSVLVAKPGSWAPSGVTLTYRWSAGSKVISGATSARFRLTAKQRGSVVKVTVTGTKSGYTKASRTSKATAAVR